MKRAIQTNIRRFCISKPHLLWQRYALGAVIIAVMVCVVHVVSLKNIRSLEQHTQLVKLVGEQRSLSQRILYHVNSSNAFAPQQRLDILREKGLSFEAAHEQIVSKPFLPDRVRAFYFEEGDMPLDSLVRRFAALAIYYPDAVGEEKTDLRLQLNAWGRVMLQDRLDAMVALADESLSEQTARLHRIQRLAFVLSFLVLLLEGLLIFLPAQYSVNTAFRKVEMRKQLLRKSLRNLKARNAELTSARKSLTRVANEDPLTRLFNRRALYERLNTPLQSPSGADHLRGVLKLDLDHFKQVNDSYGHQGGDQVLRHVAAVMNRLCTEQMTVGRIGGDEFVIFFESPHSIEEMEALATNLIRDVSVPILIDNVQVRVFVSIGYTVALSSEATGDQMLVEADLALYAAKHAGRGCFCAYSKKLAADIEMRKLLFQEISQALANDEFVPFLQPQVFAATGKIYGCEILARWLHPERGIVAPSTFIAAAEEAGLVDQIDRIMIEKGLDLLEGFDAQGIQLPCVSVNASPQTLRDPLLTERLLHDVQERHLDPSRLTIEVLESTLIEDENDIALTNIERLSDAGFCVVLDDFGTGYASMSNLSRLRLDAIKLDQSLVKPVPDPRADSIISALVTLAASLDMRVVAEGVETEAHFQTVSRLGCDVVQGFGISQPVDPDAFVSWYRSYTEDQHAAPRIA